MDKEKEVNFIEPDQLENNMEICFTCFRPFKNKKEKGKTELAKLMFCPDCCKLMLKKEYQDEQ